MRKLWAVKIERTIMVSAEDEASAKERGIESERHELWNDPDSISARLVQGLHDVPAEFRGEIPHFCEKDLTCEQVVKLQDTSTGNSHE